jgi:molybdenum cofactor guanylyltransferase
MSVIGGKTTLSRSVELVRASCGNAKIIAVEERYTSAPAEIVVDRWPGEGPLGGILTGLLNTAELDANIKWNLIIGCDMPFLTQKWLEFLCVRASDSKAQVVVADSINGLEPLCACWSVEAMPVVQAAFDSGVRRVTEAMKRVPMEVLDESTWKRFDTDGRLFWNMNTLEDFAEARRIIEGAKR